MVLFQFGSSSQSGTQTQQQSQEGFQRGSSSGSARQTTQIGEAGGMESEVLSQLISSIFANLGEARGLVEGGVGDAINTAIGDYNRVMTEGAQSAIGEVSKTGMNSSVINSMMGNLQERAGAGLAGTLMNLQANLPFQALNTVNSLTQPMMQMLQGYFLNERGMQATTESRQSGVNVAASAGSSQMSGTTSGQGTQFGFQGNIGGPS